MLSIPINHCCGCTACSSICPNGAISMQPDAEGFVYPRIDAEKCVDCHLCEKVCPILESPQLSEKFVDCVIARSRDDEVLSQSTSGGFIDALCQYVLEELKGYAVGVAFNEDFLPVHRIVHDYNEAKAFRNSKYAQSDLNGVFIEVQRLLKKGADVLFIGTPCQVAGLKSFLQKEEPKLITVDLVCRSIPSPYLWREYLSWQETRHSDAIKEVSCRKKTYGYHSGALEILFESGKRYAGSNRVDYFMKSFHSDICSRLSCYDCKFKTRHRCSDFTVFDAWNPQETTVEPIFEDDRGYSNVLVHTEKGSRYLQHMENVILCRAVPEKMFRFTGTMECTSIAYKPQRNTFYQDLRALGFEETMRKYVSVTRKDRLIESLKPIRYTIKRLLKNRK